MTQHLREAAVAAPPDEDHQTHFSTASLFLTLMPAAEEPASPCEKGKTKWQKLVREPIRVQKDQRSIAGRKIRPLFEELQKCLQTAAEQIRRESDEKEFCCQSQTERTFSLRLL